MAAIERIYTIPLGDAYICARAKRAKRAVLLVRQFALRHMKAEKARVSEGINSLIIRNGAKKPPRRIKARIVKGDDSVARVWLIGEEEKIKEAADKKKKDKESKAKKDKEKPKEKQIPKKEEKKPEAKKEGKKEEKKEEKKPAPQP